MSFIIQDTTMFQVKYKNYKLNYYLPNSISNTNYNFKYKLQVNIPSYPRSSTS